MDWQPQDNQTEKGTDVPENKEYPPIVVLGKLPSGKLVKNFAGEIITLSDRTISAIKGLGITVEDNPEEYLF